MTDEDTGDATQRAAESSPGAWPERAIGFGIVIALCTYACFQNSVSIDGVRYFWLDDDQMISMRYGRSLAAGFGLVWNPGERVEGYTNPLWTCVMALVHWLGASDAKASVWLVALNGGLVCAVLVLAERLLSRLIVPSRAARLTVMLSLVSCVDLVYWAAQGFETTLLTVVFLAAMLEAVRHAQGERERWRLYVWMGLLPLIRSDAYHVWLAVALVHSVTATRRGRAAVGLALSLVPAGVHVLWRHAYYDSWLPNTYYLKVAGVSGLWWKGLAYGYAFGLRYGVALVLCLLGAYWLRKRLWLALLGGFVVTGAYVITVGGDLFGYSRFFAHLVPVLVVLAVATTLRLSQDASARAQIALLAAVGTAMFTSAALATPGAVRSLRVGNGDPEPNVVAGVMIERFTHPDATIAVIAAGTAPYFSRRRAIDTLGKCDAHIARVPVREGPIGHNRYDPEYVLGREPDLFLSFLERRDLDRWTDLTQADLGSAGPSILAMLRAPGFFDRYTGDVLSLPIFDHGVIFLRRDSGEFATRDAWVAPRSEP